MKKFLNELFDFIKKMGIKKLIISTSVILVFLFLLITIINVIEKNNFKNKVESKEYSSYEDFKTTREYIIYSGNEYIKEEKSKVEGIENDIYVKFKEGPLENNIDNEQDYESLIYIVANTQNFYNFRLIDKDRDLVIIVECDQPSKRVTRILYNGEENYFEREKSIKSLENLNNKEEKSAEIQSTILNNIINNNWNASVVKPSERKETKNDYYIYDQYMVRVISKKIYNIVFLNNYNENIINGIKVGTNQEEIKQQLGEPDFDELGVIGYKFSNIYVFFGEQTTSIYRVETEEKQELIEILSEFRESKNSKQLASKITDIFDDYNDFKVEGNCIYIEYALRGFKIQFNVTNEHGIIFYNNYKGYIDRDLKLTDVKNKEQIPLYTYIYGEEDLVKEAEIKRGFSFGEIKE